MTKSRNVLKKYTSYYKQDITINLVYKNMNIIKLK